MQDGQSLVKDGKERVSMEGEMRGNGLKTYCAFRYVRTAWVECGSGRLRFMGETALNKHER